MKTEPMYSNERLAAMAVIALILLTVWLSGCMHTINGIGCDLKAVSEPYIQGE